MFINYCKENIINEKLIKIEINYKYILKCKINDYNYCIFILLLNFVFVKKIFKNRY